MWWTIPLTSPSCDVFLVVVWSSNWLSYAGVTTEDKRTTAVNFIAKQLIKFQRVFSFFFGKIRCNAFLELVWRNLWRRCHWRYRRITWGQKNNNCIFYFCRGWRTKPDDFTKWPIRFDYFRWYLLAECKFKDLKKSLNYFCGFNFAPIINHVAYTM